MHGVRPFVQHQQQRIAMFLNHSYRVFYSFTSGAGKFVHFLLISTDALDILDSSERDGLLVKLMK